MKKIFFLVVLCFLVFYFSLSFSEKPKIYPVSVNSKAYFDQSDRLLRLSLSSDDKYRIKLKLDQISNHLIDLTLFKEDQYFYHHPGVNPISLIRGFADTYLFQKSPKGASTITMQLARINQALYTKSIKGKLIQIWEAFKIEWHYSKEEILEAYLNQAPYGGNIEGIGTASLIYFQKSASDLTLLESFFLVNIPQSPTIRYFYSDYFDQENFDQSRRNLFLQYKKEYPDLAYQIKDILEVFPFNNQLTVDFLAPHFVDFLEKEKKIEGEIKTTLDLILQSMLERKVSRYIQSKKHIGVSNASALIVHYPTMEVKAYLGSVDFFNHEIDGQVDGIRALRSPGSTLKPFIYGLGFDQGFIHPETVLKDSPLHYGLYSPENYDQDFKGPISVANALIRSRNVPAIRVAHHLKDPNFYEFLKKIKIKKLQEESFYGLAVVLGGVEVSLHDLAKLYAMLGNKGKFSSLKFLKGEKVESSQLLTDESTYMIKEILKDNILPKDYFSYQISRNYQKVSWKTGTSNGYRDALTAGLVGPYVIIVWIGNFDGSSNPAFIGLDLAAPLFFEIIDGMKNLRGYNLTSIETHPQNLTRVKVCKDSGLIPNQFCPRTKSAMYIPGISPHKTCDIHREVKINSKNNLRSCDADQSLLISKVFEFWPSDLLEIFNRAGLPRLEPPPYEPHCYDQSITVPGLKPRILSPTPGLIYHKRLYGDDDEEISFKAITDADVKEIYWFLNQKFLGKIKKESILFWKPVPGNYHLLVMDDLGRMSEQNLEVKLIQ